MPISVEFKERMLELVEDSGLKRKELCETIPLDAVALSKILNYGIVPRTRTLIKIADYFNVSFDYLLGKSDDDYFDKAANPSNFAERFKMLKEEKGCTTYRICQVNHISDTYPSKWQKHGIIPDLEFLEILADYFDVSVDYLLGRTDYRK